MPLFRVPVQIVPRQGLLDPQGAAVASALKTVGFPDVQDVHVGRFIVVHTEAADVAAAQAEVQSMCEKLLANPVTEDFVIESANITEATAA